MNGVEAVTGTKFRLQIQACHFQGSSLVSTIPRLKAERIAKFGGKENTMVHFAKEETEIIEIIFSEGVF